MSARRHLWVGHIGGGGRGGGERGTPHTGSRGVVEAACMRATSVPWTQLGATAEGLQTLTAPSLWCAHTIPALHEAKTGTVRLRMFKTSAMATHVPTQPPTSVQ